MTTAVFYSSNATSAFQRYKQSLSRGGFETASLTSSSRPSPANNAHRCTKHISSNISSDNMQQRIQSRYGVSTKKDPSFILTPRKILIAILLVVSFFAVLLPTASAFAGHSLVPFERNVKPDSNIEKVVVQPGDTLWSIASKLEPKRDPRIVVDELTKARGTSDIYIGETIEWVKE